MHIVSATRLCILQPQQPRRALSRLAWSGIDFELSVFIVNTRSYKDISSQPVLPETIQPFPTGRLVLSLSLTPDAHHRLFNSFS
jgi:hypothetical protein